MTESDYGFVALDPADIAENPIRMFAQDWALVAAGTPEKFNALTVGWGAFGTAWGSGRPLAIVFVSPSRFTHEFLEREPYYSISVLPEEFRKALDYMGSHSGRDEDKVANAGLACALTGHGVPYFPEARLLMECKKIYSHHLSPEKFGEELHELYTGRLKAVKPHTVYFGEIVACWQKSGGTR